MSTNKKRAILYGIIWSMIINFVLFILGVRETWIFSTVATLFVAPAIFGYVEKYM